MAWGDILDEDMLDSLPSGGATVFTTEVVGPQHSPTSRGRGSYSVPTVGSPNDFTPSGPFVKEGDGIATRVRMNPAIGSFPSLAQDDDNGLKAGQTYMRSLMKAQKLYATNLATKDPQSAGMALADLDGMRDGFNALVTEGWNGREAAHVIGAVGRVFGGYGNSVENAKQLKRFADTRGVDLVTAGNELWSLQKNFGAGYLSDYGFTGKVTPESAHYENIRDNFTDLLSAMWKVEDQYDWQFDQATYRDVFNRCRRMAADLDLAGVSVKGVGAEAIVRSALKENGSLNDDARLNGDVSALMQSTTRDRGLLTLAPGFSEDTAGNPYKSQGFGTTKSERDAARADDQDFGLVRSLRQALFRHRARSVGTGRGYDDFNDTSALRQDLARSMRMFSTGSAPVSDDTFLKLADGMITSVKEGAPTSVVELAQRLAEVSSDDQAEALGVWTRSLMMNTAEGDRRLRETAYPFIEELAASTGLGYKDPAMEPLVAQVYGMVKRAFLDRRTIAGLNELTAETSDEDLWKGVRASLEPQLKKFRDTVAARNAQLTEQAMARKRAEEEG
jgi:hypothetical protein